MNSLSNILSLSKEFDAQYERFNEINNSTKCLSCAEVQDEINLLIRGLEQTTLKVSQIAMFSDNEDYEELPTESLKMLLLPALLGFLSIKSLDAQRLEVLRIVSIYFRDFIQRCNDYGITTAKAPCELTNSDDDETASKNVKTKSINDMNADRSHRIERYKKKILLKEKLDDLKMVIKSSDDETLKSYYMTLIEFYIHEVMDEFASLEMEKDMLKRIATMKKNGESLIMEKAEQRKPIKPFLITKDEVQKKIYGAGYPSLPTYTVEEFYEQRVRDGIFPGNSSAQPEKVPKATANEIIDDDDSEDARESLRSRDEWRDTHRRGYGNTYNRS